jgi:hypothetical protein
MKDKYTKGEWVIRNDNSIRVNRSVICQIGSADNNEEQSQANAKLIASAPELLEALGLAVKRLNQIILCRTLTDEQNYILTDEISSFNNTIKKATEQ